MDYRQCFDSMWMEESMNDLWEAGIKDDKLALIYKMNEQTSVSVKTPFGNTESEVVRRVVMQGVTFGPLCCSVQVDTFGKECITYYEVLDKNAQTINFLRTRQDRLGNSLSN